LEALADLLAVSDATLDADVTGLTTAVAAMCFYILTALSCALASSTVSGIVLFF